MVGILDAKRAHQQQQQKQRSQPSVVKQALHNFHSWGDWLVDNSVSETWNESSTLFEVTSPHVSTTNTGSTRGSLNMNTGRLSTSMLGCSMTSLAEQMEDIWRPMDAMPRRITARDDERHDAAAAASAKVISTALTERQGCAPHLAEIASTLDAVLTPIPSNDGDNCRAQAATSTELALASSAGCPVSFELPDVPAIDLETTAKALDKMMTPVPDVVKDDDEPRELQQLAVIPQLDMVDWITNRACIGGMSPEALLAGLPTPDLHRATQAIELSLENTLQTCLSAGDQFVEETLEPGEMIASSLDRLDVLLTPVPDRAVVLIPEIEPDDDNNSVCSIVAKSKDEVKEKVAVETALVELISEPSSSDHNHNELHQDKEPTNEEDCSKSVVLSKSEPLEIAESLTTASSFPSFFEEDEEAPIEPCAAKVKEVQEPAEKQVGTPLLESKKPVAAAKPVEKLVNAPIPQATTKGDDSGVQEHADYEINDFDRRKILGEGQFGQVWLVTEKKKEKTPFALKVLSKYDIVADDLVVNLIREIGVMKKMRGSPFIAQLVATFQDDRLVYLLEEFCQGGELFSVMHDLKKFTSYEASFYANCISRALADLHEKHIVFRDLKPENVVLDVLGYPKLIDFGYAKALLSNERTMTFCGTPRYLAPEIVAGVGHSFAVDYWALGVLIYEFLTGENPFYFDGMDEPSLFDSIQHDKYAEPNIADENAVNLISGLLIKDPRKRLSGANVFSHSWMNQWDFDLEILPRVAKAPWIPTVQNKWDATAFDNWSGLLEDRTKQKYPKLSASEASQFAPLLLL